VKEMQFLRLRMHGAVKPERRESQRERERERERDVFFFIKIMYWVATPKDGALK
jgi:hypothetical protein